MVIAKKRSPGFSGKNRGVTPSVVAPGVTHPIDASGSYIRLAVTQVAHVLICPKSKTPPGNSLPPSFPSPKVSSTSHRFSSPIKLGIFLATPLLNPTSVWTSGLLFAYIALHPLDPHIPGSLRLPTEHFSPRILP